MKYGSLILAAGHGKRTGCEIPKPLLPLEDKTLIDFVMSALDKSLQVEKVIHHVLVGHKAEIVSNHVALKYPDAQCVLQSPQLGTGHAVKVFVEALKVELDYVVVICADTPMISEQSIASLINKAKNHRSDAVVAVVDVEDPTGYGRVFEEKGQIKIIEHKDIDPKLHSHKTINTGLYVFNINFLKQNISKLSNQNASGEYYLTDIFAHTKNATMVKFNDNEEFLGINTLEQLASMASKMRIRKLLQLMKNGVIIQDLNSTCIHQQVEIGKNTIIEPQVSIEGNSQIGKFCKISKGSIIKNSQLQEGVEILPYCYITEAQIEAGAHVGPFAHLRPGASLGPEVKIGNFVEIKKARFEKGAKASHLSYIGDALIGENTNIGCGFITCNYDGINKHKTTIGKDCFIGSDTQMVAPVDIGDRCFIAAGSTITQNVPSDGFAISRGRQSVKEGIARKFIKTKK